MDLLIMSLCHNEVLATTVSIGPVVLEKKIQVY